MITRRFLLPFLAALTLSGLLTLWLGRHIPRANTVKTATTRRIVVAAKTIGAGEQVLGSSLQVVDWPSSQPLVGASERPQELLGRVLLYPLSVGEPVLSHQLAGLGAESGFAAKIPVGMRAIALHSDEVAGVAGFLRPGSFVDVLATSSGGNSGTAVTVTVAQNIRVLAVGQQSEPDTQAKPITSTAVTLLTSPQIAEELAQASTTGKIQFVLRNGIDTDTATGLAARAPTSSKEARAGAAARPVASSSRSINPENRLIVETISGNKQTAESFAATSRR